MVAATAGSPPSDRDWHHFLSFPVPVGEGVCYLWSLDYTNSSAFGQVYKKQISISIFPFPDFQSMDWFTPPPFPCLLSKNGIHRWVLYHKEKEQHNLGEWKYTGNSVILLILLEKKERALASLPL